MGNDAGEAPRLHYDVHEGDGPPMLLVHGLLAGRALWAANVDALRAVVTPVVVELLGHGRSPAPEEDAHYRPEAYVAAFERIRVEVGAERWFLSGHSLGAALMLNYVLAHPHRVLGHVFSNSASALADEAWRARVLATIDREADRIEAGGHPAVVEHRLNPTRSRYLVPPVRDGLAADVPLLRAPGIARTMRATTPDASVRDRAHTNPVPCLIVAGVRETVFEEPCHFAERTMPGVEIRRVDAGHSPNGEVPELWNEAVVGFVRRVLSGPAGR